MGEKLTKDELGGPDIHTKNGTVDNASEDEGEAFEQIRQLSELSCHRTCGSWHRLHRCDDPVERREEALLDIVPRDRRRAFDMRRLLSMVLDQGSFFEMGRGYGRSQITGLARMNGQPVGDMGERWTPSRRCNDSRWCSERRDGFIELVRGLSPCHPELC